MKAIIILFWMVVGAIILLYLKNKTTKKFVDKYLIDDKDDELTIMIKIGLTAITLAGSIAFAAFKLL